MLNHAVIMGRLTREIDVRRTGSGTAVASFSVAVERDTANKDSGNRDTDFIDCVAWRGKAEFLQKYFQKGDMIVVCGRLNVRTWKDKDGNNRRSTEIIADDVYFWQGKRDREPSACSGVPSQFRESYSDFVDPDDDDYIIPF